MPPDSPLHTMRLFLFLLNIIGANCASKVWTLVIPGYDAVGCFLDESTNRVLPRLLLQFLEETPLRCINACKGRPEKYEVAGVEGGSNCYCGYTSDIPSSNERLAPPRCNSPCSGDGDYLCGGPNAIMLYYINATRYMRTPVSPAFNEHPIYQRLLANYNKSKRPVHNATTDGITVTIDPRLINIATPEGPQSSQVQITVQLRLEWVDYFLQWDPTKPENDNMDQLRFPLEVLWTPPIESITALRKQSILESQGKMMAKVTHQGKVFVNFLEELDALCDSENVNLFPFDTLKCPFSFQTQEFDIENLKLGLLKNNLLTNFHKNQNYDLKSFNVMDPINREASGVLVHEIRAEIKLRRNSALGYYTSMLLLPVFFVTTIVSLGLFSPSNIRSIRQEKVTIALFGLMIMMLAFLLVESPDTAGRITLIGKFVMIEMMMIMVGTLVATIILFVHHKGVMSGAPVPEWMMKLTCFPRHGRIASSHGEETNEMMEEMWKKLAGNISLESDRKESSNNWLLRQCLDNIVGVRNRLEDQRGRMEDRSRWGMVTTRLDILFLVLFNLVNIILTLILFHPVRNSSS